MMKQALHLAMVCILTFTGSLNAQDAMTRDEVYKRNQEKAELRKTLIETNESASSEDSEYLKELPQKERDLIDFRLIAQASRICYERGNRERSQKRIKEARVRSRVAIQRLSKSDNELRSDVYFQLGFMEELVAFDIVAAASAYRSALEENPENEQAQRRLARVENRLRLRGIEK